MSYLIELIKSLFPDPQTALFVIVLCVVAMWMYKQLSTSLQEIKKNLVVKTEKAIDTYAELEVEIKKTLRERVESSSLEAKLAKAKAFLPYELIKELDNWVESDDGEEKFEILKDLHQKLKDEILRLKRTQYDSVSYKNNGGITEFIEVYFKTKLSTFIEPLFHTGITLFIIMTGLLMISILVTTEDWTQKILLGSMLLAYILFILILDIIVIELIVKKRFKHTKANWLIFGLFIITFFLLVFIGPWYRGILLICLSFIYAFYASQYSIKRSRAK